jgi:mannose-1-phosphate guanylyltransferase
MRFLAPSLRLSRSHTRVILSPLVLLPSHPSTGFGYVRLDERLNIPEAPNARLVSSFKEKPDARTAAAYIATGSYRWNAGMFATKTTFLLELPREYKPDLEEALTRVAAVWDDDTRRSKVLEEVWPSLEKIVIDHAVAEPAALKGRVAVVPATFGTSLMFSLKPLGLIGGGATGWNDVGDFSSIAELLPCPLAIAVSVRPPIFVSWSLPVTGPGLQFLQSRSLVASLPLDLAGSLHTWA